LDPAGGEAVGDFFPDERAESKADQPVQDAPCFLGADKVGVDLPGILQSGGNGFLSDFVKDHAFDGDFGLQDIQKVPADAFSLPVFIRGKIKNIRFFHQGFDLPDNRSLALGGDPKGLEIIIHVDA
jgi:hypothetical protein